jgi:hypothetical protein
VTGRDGEAARLEDALDDATARFARTLRAASEGGAAVSFDTGAPAPELELQRAMRALGEAHFSAQGDTSATAAAGAKISRVLSRLLERAGATARVDTRVDGRAVAATRVGLGGDCESAVFAPEARTELDAHLRSLAEQLRLRRAWTRVVLTTGEMAVKLALATGAGTPLLALPAAFRFVRGVLGELRQLEQAA